MFSLSKLSLVVLTAAAQVALLGSMIVLDNLPYQFGETIRLKVEPVDPRDFFRGDYVILSYGFSRVPRGSIEGLSSESGEEDAGREVYISLQPSGDNKYWQLKKVSLTQPQEGTWIRGTLAQWGNIETGIEAYFVQEGKGLKIEDAMRRRRNVYADVAVWRGTAKLKRVVVE